MLFYETHIFIQRKHIKFINNRKLIGEKIQIHFFILFAGGFGTAIRLSHGETRVRIYGEMGVTNT